MEYKVIETSEYIIKPLISTKHLPKTYHWLLQIIKTYHKQFIWLNKIPVDRAKATHIHKQLVSLHGEDFVGRLICDLFPSQVIDTEYVIISWVRGISNAEYFKLHNNFIIYCNIPNTTATQRLVSTRWYTAKQANEEIKQEEQIYNTSKVRRVSDISITTSQLTVEQSSEFIIKSLQTRNVLCKKCINGSFNPSMHFNQNGLCNICESFVKGFRREKIAEEIELLKTFRDFNKNKFDIMVGVSGGKDSTATLYHIQQLWFNPLAFTFDTGYLPEGHITRAKYVCNLLDCEHMILPISHLLRKNDIKSLETLCKYYEYEDNLKTKALFQKAYSQGRKKYSIKHTGSFGHIRSCIMCRKMVIRGYYHYAQKFGIRAIALGMNERAYLSSSQHHFYSGVRKLQPFKHSAPIYVFHLPFILGLTQQQLKKVLQKIWRKAPENENFVEANHNSCLLAAACESKATLLLGFHPDSTRLAREVTVWFLTRERAIAAINKPSAWSITPREVLENAGILLKR